MLEKADNEAPSMANFLLVIFSAILIIASDALIKRASGFNWGSLFVSKAMILCYILYAIQIVFGVFIFRSKGEFSIYTNLFVIFYSILGVVTGYFIFGEKLNIHQYIGITIALVGIVLLYW